MDPHFTPTERRILALLSDGLMHTREEMIGCLYDELSGLPSLRVIVCRMNKKLKPIGQELVCRSMGAHTVRYQHVRLLASTAK